MKLFSGYQNVVVNIEFIWVLNENTGSINFSFYLTFF